MRAMEIIEFADRVASEIKRLAISVAANDSETPTDDLRDLLVEFAEEIKREAIEL